MIWGILLRKKNKVMIKPMIMMITMTMMKVMIKMMTFTSIAVTAFETGIRALKDNDYQE